jgi:hypothetical protein
MGTHRTSVYLSGWDYNRLLQEDPAQPRISALPATLTLQEETDPRYRLRGSLSHPADPPESAIDALNPAK